MRTGTKGDFKETIFDEVNENIRALETLFPSGIKDGQVDFEALKEALGEFEEVGPEKYELTWSGKKNAKKVSQEDIIAKTLKYIPEDSVNPDTTENLYIEGDNLEVLKLLRQNYYGAIKMIYIDPPYNTGNDFVYNDSFSMQKEESDILEGDISELGERYTVNSKSSNKYHAKWLNMMYPRLRVAKDLLADDGVIFISIDDNEVDNLKRVLDEIYGEENFLGRIMPVVNPGGRDYKQIALTHEYLLVYCKGDSTELQEITKDIDFKMYDNMGGYEIRDLRNRNPKFHSGNRPNLFYPFYVNPDVKDEYGCCAVSLESGSGYYIEIKPYNSIGKESVWRWGRIKVNQNIVLGDIKNSQIVAKPKKDGGWTISEKNRRSTTKVKSIWTETEMRTEEGTRMIRNIFGFTPFDHPKPVGLIKRVVEMGCESDIILDFFSGSGSTAHSVIESNLIDKKKRKFIMVQLPEKLDEKTEAYKNGYRNICEIGRERIRRAGEILKEENKDKEGIDDLDIGFKVFRVDDTNIRWIRESEELRTLASEVTSKESIQQTTFNYIAATTLPQVALDDVVSPKDRIDFMPGFKDIDVVYELLLRQRDIPLSAKVRQLNNIGGRTYLFDESFLVCLEEDITNELVEKIASINPLPIKFILRDSAFGDDINLKDETNRRLKTLIERNTGETKKTYTVEYI